MIINSPEQIITPEGGKIMIIKNDKLTDNQKKINAQKLLNLIKTRTKEAA